MVWQSCLLRLTPSLSIVSACSRWRGTVCTCAVCRRRTTFASASLYVPCYCPSVSDAWGRLYGSLVLTVFASFCLDSFTGAYVFYWLLLLLLYMSAYFLATKSESNNSSDYSAGAQVVRQLVTFLIASKGYLDYVIWFAVNNIEKYVSPRAVGGSPVQGEG